MLLGCEKSVVDSSAVVSSAKDATRVPASKAVAHSNAAQRWDNFIVAYLVAGVVVNRPAFSSQDCAGPAPTQLTTSSSQASLVGKSPSSGGPPCRSKKRPA